MLHSTIPGTVRQQSSKPCREVVTLLSSPCCLSLKNPSSSQPAGGLLWVELPHPLLCPSWVPIALRENPSCVPVLCPVAPLSPSVSQAGSTSCFLLFPPRGFGVLAQNIQGFPPWGFAPQHQAEDVPPAQRAFSDNPLTSHECVSLFSVSTIQPFLSPLVLFPSYKPAWLNLDVNNPPGLAARG